MSLPFTYTTLFDYEQTEWYGTVINIILQIVIMTLEQFDILSEEDKSIEIFEAIKVTERFNQRDKYELFQIDDFFVEIKTSLQHLSRRVISTYTSRNVPGDYLNESLPQPRF